MKIKYKLQTYSGYIVNKREKTKIWKKGNKMKNKLKMGEWYIKKIIKKINTEGEKKEHMKQRIKIRQRKE